MISLLKKYDLLIKKQNMNRFLQHAFWVLVITGTVFGLYLYVQRTDWSPTSLMSNFIPKVVEDRLFVPGHGIEDQEQARKIFHDALKALYDEDYETAASEFQRLESVYPGLLEVILLREAQAHAALGNEMAVQQKLKTLLQKRPDSPLAARAMYQLGQSHFRAQEHEQAKTQFLKLRKQYPETGYATGGLYYLGELYATTDREKAIESWRAYLGKCTGCMLSVASAEGLNKILAGQLREEDMELAGLAYANQEAEWDKAIRYLSQVDVSRVWYELGKSHIKNGSPATGIQILTENVIHAKDKQVLQKAVELILANSNATPVNVLKNLAAKNLPDGGDYVLWRLTQVDSGNARSYYERIVRNYPFGDYAPESSWNLLWFELKQGNHAAFLSKAEKHMDKYPYARSAPKTLFWMAKVTERQNPITATRMHQKVLDTYPTSYYAYRSQGRLQELLRGKKDPGWVTFPNRKNYPPKFTLRDLDILPPVSVYHAAHPAYPALMERMHRMTKELKELEDAEALRLVLDETLGEVPPKVQSWIAHMQGDKARGVRTIREALLDERKPGEPLPSPPNADEMKLLYPVYFDQIIGNYARRNNLDPYLVQSLMREESHFNELAVSSSNAQGLMQLLPTTAQEVAGWEKLGSFNSFMLFQPETNVQLGSRYLRFLHDFFNDQSMPAVGAYNGGPNAMKRWINQSTAFAQDPDFFIESIPYEQTRDYIKKVYESFWNYSRLYGQEAPAIAQH